jgi:hypothetical protein
VGLDLAGQQWHSSSLVSFGFQRDVVMSSKPKGTETFIGFGEQQGKAKLNIKQTRGFQSSLRDGITNSNLVGGGKRPRIVGAECSRDAR